MNKCALRHLAVLLVFTVLTVQTAFSAFAVSTADANEKIKTDAVCSLTLTYLCDDAPCQGLEAEIYPAAVITEDYEFSLAGPFEKYSVDINAVASQSEWDAVTDTLSAYIIADEIAPMAMAVTDEKGMISFKDLAVGIYYLRWTGNMLPGDLEGFEPFLISVPTVGEDGKWVYDVAAFPKPTGSFPTPGNTPETLKVIKQWRDNSDKERPVSVDVDIYRDNVLFKQVSLNAENNWSCTWGSAEKHEWTVVEHKVPDRYTVTVEREGQVFVITNTKEEPLPPPPPSGDTLNIGLYVVLLAVSGAALILVVVLGRRRSDA